MIKMNNTVQYFILGSSNLRTEHHIVRKLLSVSQPLNNRLIIEKSVDMSLSLDISQ